MDEQRRRQLHQAWTLLSFRGELQWFGLRDGKPSGGRLYSPTELETLVTSADRLQMDLYLSLNPVRRCGVKSKREDVLVRRYILADLDPLPGVNVPPKRDEEYANVFVFTGRGFHRWYMVLDTSPQSPQHQEFQNQEFLKSREPILGDAPRGWQLDLKVGANLDRVVRCPGSVNHRTGLVAEILTTVPGKYVDTNDLLAFGTPPEYAPAPKVYKDLMHLTDLLPHLNDTSREFLLRGWQKYGKHNACLAAVRSLRELGVPQDVALGWATAAGEMCHPQLDTRYIERTVRQVYEKEGH